MTLSYTYQTSHSSSSVLLFYFNRACMLQNPPPHTHTHFLNSFRFQVFRCALTIYRQEYNSMLLSPCHQTAVCQSVFCQFKPGQPWSCSCSFLRCSRPLFMLSCQFLGSRAAAYASPRGKGFCLCFFPILSVDFCLYPGKGFPVSLQKQKCFISILPPEVMKPYLSLMEERFCLPSPQTYIFVLC